MEKKKKEKDNKNSHSPWIEHCAFIPWQHGKLSAFPAIFPSSSKHLKGFLHAGLVGGKGVNKEEKIAQGVKKGKGAF